MNTKKLSRRTFVAAAAATVAAPAQMLAAAAPVGSILAAAGITFARGAAIPAGFDFRDPYSGAFMSLGMFYIQCEDGTAYTDKGFETSQAAVDYYVQCEQASRDDWRVRCPPDELKHYLHTLRDPRGEISADGEYNAYMVVHGETYLRDLLTVHIPENDAPGDPYFGRDGKQTAMQDFEAAQNDPEWNGTWGGGG